MKFNPVQHRCSPKWGIVLFFLCAFLGFSADPAHAQAGNFGVGTALPGSKLTVNGSFAATYKNIDANATLNGTDFYVAVNSTAARTITLPAATAASPGAGNILGRTYHIKNTGSFDVTVAASNPELLDNQSGAGVSSIKVPAGYYIMIISKGTIGNVTTWEVVFIGNINSFVSKTFYGSTTLGTDITNAATTLTNFKGIVVNALYHVLTGAEPGTGGNASTMGSIQIIHNLNLTGTQHIFVSFRNQDALNSTISWASQNATLSYCIYDIQPNSFRILAREWAFIQQQVAVDFQLVNY